MQQVTNRLLKKVLLESVIPCSPNTQQSLLVGLCWPVSLSRDLDHEVNELTLVAFSPKITTDKPYYGRGIKEAPDIIARVRNVANHAGMSGYLDLGNN